MKLDAAIQPARFDGAGIKMRTKYPILLILACAAPLSGCLAPQVAKDGKDIRRALEEIYTDQVIDNLIRARENRPFVQLKYSQLSVKDTETLAANVNGGGSDFTTRTVTDVSKAAALRVVRTTDFLGKYPFGMSGQRDRTMSFRADPVTDQNYIYEYYLSFAKNPYLFHCSEAEPREPVHIKRKCGDRWYWVPAEAGQEFLNLVLRTSFLPPPAAPAEVAWDAAITSINPRYDKDGVPLPNKYVVTLSRDVPSDQGPMQVLDSRVGRKIWLQALPLEVLPFLPGITGQATTPGVLPGAPTRSLYVVADPRVLPPEEAAWLTGASVLYYSQNYPNPSPKLAADPQQKVLDLLDNIRIQLTSPTTNIP